MTAGSAIALTAPPPTINVLDNKQRHRLVRSTRKLGAILGATPHLTESSHTQVIQLTRYTSSSTSSASSSRSATPDSVKASRRHASICSHPTNQPKLVFASSTASSSVISLVPSDSGVKSLTKKPSMKFKSSKPRGSNELPRPLILRISAVPPPITVRQPVSPSPSSASGFLTPSPGTPTPTGTPALTPTTPVFPSSAELRRKRMAKLTRTLGEIIPPYLVSASKRPTALAEPGSVPSSPISSAPPPQVQSTPVRTRQRRSMSVDYSGKTFTSEARASPVWATGSHTWRGEWNRKDIKDVQKQLRSLKAR
ncbi:hypothetical protein BDW22DRAFT_607856 [Trametopsis cervina]|nr:hypothetical protein BDW22DRAFT_607856 [Trametopsis cervina]